ncbi:MAG: hypothetical protein PWP24_1623 [Clostridiales bacterium]|nr:hypothetical protein [Clostridiales bacterium]
MKINEVAKRTGITVRTLHYYDEIGLLPPSEITEAGYRLYDDTSLETLQQILFFRELEFSLQEIKSIMENPAYKKEEALCKQRDLLLKKRARMDQLIQLLNDRIKGDRTMNFQAFDQTELEQAKNEYAKEAKERWGTTRAYQEYEEKTASYSKEQWNLQNKEGAALLKEFAAHRLEAPDSKDAFALVKKWQSFITANFYTCTLEILSGLGQMYIADSRFQMNIDKNGVGTAQFMADAIAAYCLSFKK